MTDAGLPWSRLALASLLLLAIVSAVVLAEVEGNYAATVRSEDATAQVTAVDPGPDGLLFTIGVENPLDDPIRVDYVRLRLSEGGDSVVVSVPFGERESVPPGRHPIEAFVSERRHDSLSPIEGTITVRGYVAVAVYNGHEFTVSIAESEVEP